MNSLLRCTSRKCTFSGSGYTPSLVLRHVFVTRWSLFRAFRAQNSVEFIPFTTLDDRHRCRSPRTCLSSQRELGSHEPSSTLPATCEFLSYVLSLWVCLGGPPVTAVTQRVSFCVWLVSPSSVLRAPHAVAGVRLSSLRPAEEHSVVCRGCGWRVPSAVEGHLGCSPFVQLP